MLLQRDSKGGRGGRESTELAATNRKDRMTWWGLGLSTDSPKRAFNEHPEEFAVPYCCSGTIFSWPRLFGESTQPSGLLPGFKQSFGLVNSSCPHPVSENGKEEMR